MAIKLSDHFSLGKLLKFVFPSIAMMVFTSIYGVVDGLFVSNYAGKDAFTAVNLIFPFIMVLGALGFMIGTGGTAIVAKTLGEANNREKANGYFSLLVYTTIILGVIVALVGIFTVRPISRLLGAEGVMVDYCVRYARIIFCALPFFMLQNIFQSFFVSAEKPQLGLFVTVGAGVTNIVLDYLLVGVLPWGLEGAAIATAISQTVGGVVPLVYFALPNSSTLKLTKARLEWWVLVKTCTNGMSELLGNISMSVVSMLYNFKLIEVAGNDGVAAYGVIMYLQFIFASIFIGYAIGVAPIVSYNYGAENHRELKGIFKKSLKLMLGTGIVMMIMSIVLSSPLSKVFVGYDEKLYNITVEGFRLFSVAFLPCGINIFASSFYTALNNGVVSAVLSVLRTVVFQVIMVLVLPVFWGLEGIWFSSPMTEILSVIVAGVFFIALRKKYQYI
ncbi:MAG: MATE family efflux transporter [Clostridia bacterium]|nr:MATE family efflux transporter [Clostridia bacterium]